MYCHKTFFVFVAIVCICSAADVPQPRRRQLQVRNNRQASACDDTINLDEILNRLLDLVALDQALQKKVDVIDKKLTAVEAFTHTHLEMIGAQQQEHSRQLVNLENMERNVQATVGDVRNELDVVQYSMQQKLAEPTHVHTRQAVMPNNETESVSQRLESLGIFLASTRVSIARIESTLATLGTNFSKLLQLTRGTHKRLSNFSNRRHNYNGPQQPQYPQPYGPPLPYPTEPSSCAQASLSETGIQRVQLEPSGEPFYLLCDSAEKGGWTIIHTRFDGSINFNRDWEEYKAGFGNMAGEFFIGLEKLHAITATALHELEFVLVDFNNVTRTARYSSFAIGGEKEFYALQILGQYSGTAGDSFSVQAGNKFSTFDNDNDGWVEGNCAQAHTGAWWYGACELSNLNGQYLRGEYDETQSFQGMYWNDFRGPLYSLKSVQIKIRPIEAKDAL